MNEDITITIVVGRTGGRFITLAPGESAVFGRGNGTDFKIGDTWVSRRHFRIANNGLDWTLADLGSRHGTWVNDKNVASAVLASGDKILAGNMLFQVTFGAENLEIEKDSFQTGASLRNLFRSLSSRGASDHATLGDSR